MRLLGKEPGCTTPVVLFMAAGGSFIVFIPLERRVYDNLVIYTS